jgi:Protein of unknown function (DUF1631)
MALSDSAGLSQQARRLHVERLMATLPVALRSMEQGIRSLANQAAEPALATQRRELVLDWGRMAGPWLSCINAVLHRSIGTGRVPVSQLGDLSLSDNRASALTLVDDDTIENEILGSRLALAMMDKAGGVYNDLCARIHLLESSTELDANDVLRPHVLGRVAISAWRNAGLTLEAWRAVQPVLYEEFSRLIEERYQEINQWLIQRQVLPDTEDMRGLIRRTPGGGGASPGDGHLRSAASSPAEETRLMTRTAAWSRSARQSQEVMGQLNQLMQRQVPEFVATQRQGASPRLKQMIQEIQTVVDQHEGPAANGGQTAAMLLNALNQRKQRLKESTNSPVERATIEIVALLFQSILTEERIPAVVRVWFARLQMPVLRVAVSEPDFFAGLEHPARRLIDRMGACVMGFDNTARNVGGVLEKEIKRIVQVVEAYPDTGRRVFATVLTEFEKFLEHYFKNENEASRKGVSLAQQVEHRETLAIQYTIELRKMLDKMPVQETVREFLFHVWADVLAMTAVKTGLQGEPIKIMKRAAADLIWSASAKVSREERAEVIRGLNPLLKTIRDGMADAGLPAEKQDEHIKNLNDSLAAAFTAKAAAIPKEHFEELMARLESLEELLPEAAEIEIDEAMVLDLSGHESSELEVVEQGGSMPTPAMMAWARELQVGGWYMLNYRDRNEPVQLAWQGLRKQLTLFVSPQGRGVLFQQNRLAAFLQAGLLVPAQDESLTVKATRDALAKLDGDPRRLLN